MIIRPALDTDFPRIWPIFQQTVAAGDTYACDRDISKQEAKRLWMQLPKRAFVAEENNYVVGTYYLKTNQAGPGGHVCNSGYMVAIWWLYGG